MAPEALLPLLHTGNSGKTWRGHFSRSYNGHFPSGGKTGVGKLYIPRFVSRPSPIHHLTTPRSDDSFRVKNLRFRKNNGLGGGVLGDSLKIEKFGLDLRSPRNTVKKLLAGSQSFNPTGKKLCDRI